jgi:predicted transcriptional regulator
LNSRDQEFKPDLYVIARIIKTLMEEGPLNKTKLATYSGLAYDKFITYLDWMSSKEFVAEENGLIIVLDEGIRTYQRLVEWILKYVGKLKFSRKRF